MLYLSLIGALSKTKSINCDIQIEEQISVINVFKSIVAKY